MIKNDELILKDQKVTELIIYLFEKYGDFLLFTGGTSLAKSGLINRFSEDVDLLINKKCSRKDIVESLRTFGDVKELEESNDDIRQFEMNVSGVRIKVDIKSIDSSYFNFMKSQNSLKSISSINGEIKENTNINIKKMEFIFIDKCFAILENYGEKFKSIPKRKYVKNKIEFDIRLSRHYYDICILYDLLKLFDVKDF